MSVGQILFKKQMKTTDSEEDGSDENVWDDSEMIEAYDEAMRIAEARRLAVGTNTSTKLNADNSKTKKNKSLPKAESSKHVKNKESKTLWKEGMFCRAVYSGDEQEYEAVVKRIINEKECIVSFIGYDDSEIVQIKTLKPSQGGKERAKQLHEASHNENVKEEAEECDSDRTSNPHQTGKHQRKKKHGKGHKYSSKSPAHDFPFPLPDISNLTNMNLDSVEPMIPPPPVSLLRTRGHDSEEQALSSMLISWYMNGYYTGLYQGMKRAKNNHRHN